MSLLGMVNAQDFRRRSTRPLAPSGPDNIEAETAFFTHIDRTRRRSATPSVLRNNVSFCHWSRVDGVGAYRQRRRADPLLRQRMEGGPTTRRNRVHSVPDGHQFVRLARHQRPGTDPSVVPRLRSRLRGDRSGRDAGRLADAGVEGSAQRLRSSRKQRAQPAANRVTGKIGWTRVSRRSTKSTVAFARMYSGVATKAVDCSASLQRLGGLSCVAPCRAASVSGHGGCLDRGFGFPAFGPRAD